MNNLTKYYFPTQNFSARAKQATTMDGRGSNDPNKDDLQDLQKTEYQMYGEGIPC